MKLFIPENPESYGETSKEEIEIVQNRMEIIALKLGWKVEYYLDSYWPSVLEKDAYKLSNRVFELCMDCAAPSEKDGKRLIAALNEAKDLFPFYSCSL